ncbi:MAG: hypothetical protein KER_03071 [Kerstersia gyiorum]|uniref:hypothetical protein n=1 Tax=Kerstersia gyiorum TaxID=206506 RepID=UPI0030CCE83D
MKYAKEVIDLMVCYPGRRFKVRNLTNAVAASASVRERASVRRQILRVLAELEDMGQVDSTRSGVVNGGDAEYWWKPRHLPMANRDRNRDNIARTIAS